jgi:hypothetical protein
MKKTIALILSVIMLFSVMSTSIFAGGYTGDVVETWEDQNALTGWAFMGGTFGFNHIILNINAVRTLTVVYKCHTAVTSPVQSFELKIPAIFKGTIGVMPVTEAYLASISKLQFVPKFNMIYPAPADSEFDNIIYVAIPSGYVVLPEKVVLDVDTRVFTVTETETLTVATGDASWILSYEVLTKETYASVLEELTAFADMLAAAEVAAAAEGAEEEAVALEIDVDASIAAVQEAIGGVEVFDLSTIIIDLDEDGVISADELMAAWFGLEENELVSEELLSLIDGALFEILGDFYEMFADFLAGAEIAEEAVAEDAE